MTNYILFVLACVTLPNGVGRCADLAVGVMAGPYESLAVCNQVGARLLIEAANDAPAGVRWGEDAALCLKVAGGGRKVAGK